MTNQPYLVLLTSQFPYHNRETFLETEITYLGDHFEKIFIFPHETQPNYLSSKRNLPSNVEALPIQFDINFKFKFRALGGLFDVRFWKETIFIIKDPTIKFSKATISTALISLVKAKVIKAAIKRKLHTRQIQLSDCFYYSYWWDDAALALSLLKHKEKELKCVTRTHGGDLYLFRNSINYLPYKKYTYKKFDQIYFISQDGLTYLKDKLRCKLENAQVSRLGVKKSKAHLLNKDYESFALLSCSSVIPVKRVELILSALSFIKDLHIKWYHIGDGPYYNELIESSKLILDDNPNIEFIPLGRVKNHLIQSKMYEIGPSIFINVSESEGIPVSIMEAFSVGIPAIATDVGGVREIVNSTNGYLLPKNSTPEEIANAIRSFFELSRKEKEMMSKNAYYTWESDYNAEKNYRTFIKDLK
jgi:glycosyltransferase involved in cell wall biosynthesis